MSSNIAHQLYFLPVTLKYVTLVIEKESGDQTALNCGTRLKENGILDYYNVRVLSII